MALQQTAPKEAVYFFPTASRTSEINVTNCMQFGHYCHVWSIMYIIHIVIFLSQSFEQKGEEPAYMKTIMCKHIRPDH